jgi:Caspase domain
MSENPSPESTLVVLLGASEFPKAPGFTPSPAFRGSADKLRDYLLSTDGFDLPSQNLLDLFNSDLPSPDLDERVSQFLEKRTDELQQAMTPVRDVLVYYVGHGAFSEDGSDYYLAIRDSRARNESFSSYQMKALAKTLNEQARERRKYLILDCCFSATAYASFQSAPLEVARQQTLEEFPDKGTALLCASGAKEPAKAPPGQPLTMFSGALIDVLTTGAPEESESFSLSQIGEMVQARLRKLYRDQAVRPQVLAPDQRQGDLSKLPLFPNAALRGRRMLAGLQRFETDLAAIRQTQSEQGSRYQELSQQVQRLDSTIQKLQDDFTNTVTKTTELSLQEHDDPGPFGFTRSEWNQIPPSIKDAIYDYRDRSITDRYWILSCGIICTISWLVMMTSMLYFRGIWITELSLGEVFTDPVAQLPIFLCWFMTAISLVSIAIYSFKRRAPMDNEPGMGGQWVNHEIVIAAQRTRAAVVIPGLELSMHTLAVTTLAYVVTSLAGLVSGATPLSSRY